VFLRNTRYAHPVHFTRPPGTSDSTSYVEERCRPEGMRRRGRQRQLRNPIGRTPTHERATDADADRPHARTPTTAPPGGPANTAAGGADQHSGARVSAIGYMERPMRPNGTASRPCRRGNRGRSCRNIATRRSPAVGAFERTVAQHASPHSATAARPPSPCARASPFWVVSRDTQQAHPRRPRSTDPGATKDGHHREWADLGLPRPRRARPADE